MQLINNKILTRTALLELKLLIEDCPEALASLEEFNERLNIKSERKKIRKEAKKMRGKAIQDFLAEYPNHRLALRDFANFYWILCDPIVMYNKGCE